jgi:hypothetical protein
MDNEGNDLYVYRLKGDWAVGDILTITGQKTTYNGSIQINSGATAVKEGTHTEHVWTDATCTEPKGCILCDVTEGDANGHSYANGECTVCGAKEVVAGATLPENLSFAGAANKASADEYLATNYSSWTTDGKLGQGYADYLGFGRGSGAASPVTLSSPNFSTTSAFTITAVIKGNGTNGTVTSTLIFTLVDANGNVVATGYANNSSSAEIVPVDGTDTTYDISFTFENGKSWSDVSKLAISFTKNIGNIGLKSVTFNQ